MRVDDLDHFLAVARHGQIRRAAVELGVSQPAITKTLHRLERELGFPLFERSVRGMTLTPVAVQFHERIRLLRGSLADAVKEAADLHLGAMGLLRIGVSPLYVKLLFEPAWLKLHAQRPAARIKVTSTLNEGLLLALRRGELDLCVSALPADLSPQLRSHPLLRDDLWIIVRQHHPLLLRRRLRLADLADQQWLLPGPGVTARQRIEARFTERDLPAPRVAVEVEQTTGQLTGLLRGSDLVSVMSASMLRTAVGRGLQALPLAEARFERTVAAITRREPTLPPLATRMIQVLEEIATREARSTRSA